MSEHLGDRPVFLAAAESRGVLRAIKKAPEPVLNRLNEIAAEINGLAASKAEDEESSRGARDILERATRVIANIEERGRLRELQLAELQNERKAIILLVVTAYQAGCELGKATANGVCEIASPTSKQDHQNYQAGGAITRLLAQSNEPLTRREIADRLPGTNAASVSTRLSQLKADGLIKQVGGKRWQIK